MKRNLLLSVAIAGMAALLTALPALAQTYLDTASGNETMATSAQGWFSGNATGNLPGSWSATIIHTPLAPCAAPLSLLWYVHHLWGHGEAADQFTEHFLDLLTAPQ